MLLRRPLDLRNLLVAGLLLMNADGGVDLPVQVRSDPIVDLGDTLGPLFEWRFSYKCDTENVCRESFLVSFNISISS